MLQTKALVKKEYWTQKKTLLLPFIIQGAMYLIIAILFAISYFRGDLDFSAINFEITKFDIDSTNVFFWILGFMNSLFPAVLILAIYSGMAVSVVNDDFKHNCILFYSTTPVSFLNKSLVKIAFVLGSTAISFFIMALVNIFLQTAIIAPFININIFYVLLGFLQSYIQLLLSMLMIFSLIWLFSAIFISKTASKFFLSYVIYKAILGIGSTFWGVFSYFNALERYIFRLIIPNTVVKIDDLLSENQQIRNLIIENWNSIFSQESLQKILFAIAFFTVASIIIKKREVV